MWDETRGAACKNRRVHQHGSSFREMTGLWERSTISRQRTLQLNLDFLKAGITYEATIYKDAPDAHGIDNPEAYVITRTIVKKGDVIPAALALGGGHAMILRPVEELPERGSAPSIVVVIADDMAWADVSYNGQLFFETPHIDQLAADGMRFNHAYSGASVCSPSRACLISGMYSPRHSIYHPGNRAPGETGIHEAGRAKPCGEE